MKLKKFALTLTAATLLPTFACAATDEVVASFERALHHAPSASRTVPHDRAADPLVEAISVALNGTTDEVLASFERDLNRAPTAADAAVIAGEADPLAAINAVLWSEIDKPVVHAALANSGG